MVRCWWLVVLASVATRADTAAERDNRVVPLETELRGTQLLKVFAIFRHGDRTPDPEEFELYPNDDKTRSQYFPYGTKALTNLGKARSYGIGQALRGRYDGFLSRLYIPSELRLRCTDYDRTKMSALTAMAALYPPEGLQRWNPTLAWQPVPYDVEPQETCDMLYWYNCPAYHKLRYQVYALPEIQNAIKSNSDLFDTLSHFTGAKITTPENVFYLDNLFQTEENVGIAPPAWSLGLMQRIKDMTKLEYQIEFYNDKMISLAFGKTLRDILIDAEKAVKGISYLPKLRLYSAHENNVAAMMAACGVFYPHQPSYSSIFALELRRVNSTGKYAFAAVYTPEPGRATRLLPISGCGGGVLCDYEKFVQLTANLTLTQDAFRHQCGA